MGKKSHNRSNRALNHLLNDPSSQMMTQQEEKMLYSTKKHTQSQFRRHETGNKSKNRQDDQEQSEYQELDQIQISNLNQTSAEQITEFINRLIAKNKVSSKNAFDIPLIHLEQMQDFRAALNDNTWKRLSCTLQNDYKIYGYRVDAAHTITYKMVQSIARHEATNEGTIGLKKQINSKLFQSGKIANNSQFLESLIENSFTQNVSRNKLNVDYGKFIQKNHKLLNVSHIQSFFGYNPGLEKTKRKFDQQGFKALLLNNIALRNGCQLKLDEHYYAQNEEQDGKAKKEVQEKDRLNQDSQMNQTQINKFFAKIFNGELGDKILAENYQNQRGIFDQIRQLNIDENSDKRDDFSEIERVYQLISGQGRLENNNQSKKRVQQIVEEKNQIRPQIIQLNLNNPAPIINNAADPIDFERPAQKNQILSQNEASNQEPVYQNMSQIHNQYFKDLVQNIASQQNVTNNPSTSQFTQKPNPNLSQNDQSQNLQYKKSLVQLIIQTKQSDQQNDHVLVNKNFQMKELNLQNISQNLDSSQDQLNQSNQLTGNIKNIQQYIKIRQSKRKNQAKINIDFNELTSEQIGNRLFNRKSKIKKSKNIKNEPQSNQQNQKFQKTKRVDWTKMTKSSHNLTRSVIFKKSLADQRNFNQLKQKVKLNIQKRKTLQNIQKQNDFDHKNKAKKSMKLFDLPIYQFQEGDVNYITPIQEIDPQTSELQFSQVYKRNYPSFVFEAGQILESIEKKKQQKKRDALENRKKFQEKKSTENEQQLKIVESQPLLEQSLQQTRKQVLQENSDNISPDISFIYDEVGQRKSNQVVIRQAKEKVRGILLAMLSHIKAKRMNETKKRQNKISFKKIYEAYYRQEGYISPALCFLTILHLANQHNLVLQGKEDGSNFKVFIQDQNNMSQNQETQRQANNTRIYLEASFFDKDDSSLSSMRMEQQN